MLPSSAILRCLLLLFFTITIHAQCNTDQNPSCAGNSQFETLCCSPGSVCYWSNRNGDPACCAAGTDCRGDGGPAPIQVTQVQATTYYAETTYSSTVSQESTKTYFVQSTSSYSPPPQSFTSLSTVVTPAVVVVTSTFPVVQTAPAETNGAYVTVTQVQVISRGARLTGSRRGVFVAAAGAVAALTLFG